MPYHVVQSFLEDSIDVDAGTAIDWKRIAGFLVADGDPGLLFHHGNVPVHGAFEAGLIEHHRMERLREAANIFESLLRDVADFTKIAPNGGALRHLFFGTAQECADGGENLSEFIVQFPGDVAKRGFLSGNQFLSEFAALSRKVMELREKPAIQTNEVEAGDQNR